MMKKNQPKMHVKPPGKLNASHLLFSLKVNQVTQKMKDNIGRLLEREQSLDALADLSDQVFLKNSLNK